MKKLILLTVFIFLTIGIFGQARHRKGVYSGDPEVEDSLALVIKTLTNGQELTFIKKMGSSEDTAFVSLPSAFKASISDVVLIMHVIEDEIVYTNTTQTTIISLPSNAVIWDIQVEVRTAFTGSGTDLLDIGITGTANHYENDLDISGTGFGSMSLTNIPDRMTGTTNITFQYIDQNSDAGAGQAYVYIHYSLH